MEIRRANLHDLDAIVLLADQKGRQYEVYQPVFHRLSESSMELRRPFLKSLIENSEIILLVGVIDSSVEGFIFAQVVKAPPVYNPGGKVCFIDDFVVKSPENWPSQGKNLLDRTTELSKKQGASLATVVCGPKDAPKRQMLIDAGCDIASEWRVKSIDGAEK